MPHYFDENQDSEIRTSRITADLRGNILNFKTASGMFSPKKVDIGTRILIEHAIIPETKLKILDLGCGYGPVGIAIAKAYPESEIVMTDINKRAVSAAKYNIKLNKIHNAKALQGNMFEKIVKKFDIILLNPPQHAGKQVCIEMIHNSKRFLKDKGLFQLVCRHNKGGKSLSEEMSKVFGNLTTIVKRSGFRVYVSKNNN